MEGYGSFPSSAFIRNTFYLAYSFAQNITGAEAKYTAGAK